MLGVYTITCCMDRCVHNNMLHGLFFHIFAAIIEALYRSGTQVIVYPPHGMRPPAMLAITDNVIESLKSEESTGTDQKL